MNAAHGHWWRLGLLLAALALALTLAAGSPAGPVEPVGDRINVFAGMPTSYPAGQPFHVRHGWGVGTDAPPDLAGLFGFELEVDGSPRSPEAVLRTTDATKTTFEDVVLNRAWLFNFEAGLSGTHTFTGRWLAPCRLAVEELGYPAPCERPNEVVVALERSLTVDFVRRNLALGASVTASSEYPGNPASLAVDGSWWSYWNSGDFPPQWIEVDLGAPVAVGEIKLGITQLPDCFTVHRLYARAEAGDPYTLLHEFAGFTVDQLVLAYHAPSPATIRYVRVETSSSCSWVAWREIEVYGPGA